MKESYFKDSELSYITTSVEKVKVKYAPVTMYIVKNPHFKAAKTICPICKTDSLVRSLGWINSEVYYCVHDKIGEEGRTIYYMYVD